MRKPAGAAAQEGIHDKTTRGTRICLATPRLRALLGLNLSVAAAGAMVIVNTIVIVQSLLGRPNTDVAVALACFGGGSMAAALVLPHLLEHLADRCVMLPAAVGLGAVLLVFATASRADATVLWPALLVSWMLLGLGYSTIMTPTGRLLRRSAQAADRPALFAAQFALSHALARHLSARRLARERRRHRDDVVGARRPHTCQGRRSSSNLAGRGPRGADACPSASSRKPRARRTSRPCFRDRRPAPPLAVPSLSSLRTSPSGPPRSPSIDRLSRR